MGDTALRCTTEHVAQRKHGIQRRHQQRQAACPVDHRAHVLLANGKEGVRTDLLVIGRKTDPRQQGHAGSPDGLQAS